MTTKADFTPQEWDLVLEGPPSAGMIVITAQRGGTLRETVSMAKAGGPGVDSAAIKAGLRAGSWAAACMVAAEWLPSLSSPDAQWGGRRDRQPAGRANR